MALKRSALLFAGVLLVGISAYGQPTSGTWSTNGPEGVSTPKLYIDSSNPSTLYLTPVANLYKSTDGGESWRRILNGGTNFAISPANPNVLLYSGTDGPVRSEDQGRTWTRVQYPPGGNLAVPVTFLFDPHDSKIVYEVQELIVGRPCFCSIGQIYNSVDGGQTWSVDFETSSEGGAYPKIAGAAIDSRSTVWVFGSVLYRRLSGASRSIVLSVPVTTLAIDPRDPARLYAGGSDGLYLSMNGGDSWTLSALPINVSSVVVNTAGPSEVFAKAGANWFRSGNYGLTWTLSPTGDTDLLASDPTNPAVIYGREGSELRKTTDRGLEWRPVVGGLKATAISGLVADPIRPGHVYAAANNSGFVADAATETDLYETNDAGKSWVRLSPIPADYVTTLGFDPDSATLYARSDLGVFGSSDGGKSWRLLLPMARSYAYLAMALAPSNPRIIYAGGPTLFRTTDGGSSWSSIPSAFEVSPLAVDPRNAEVVYAAGCDGKGFCGLLKSADAGMSWVRLAPPASSSANVLVIDAVDPRNVYVGSYDRVYRSSDEGLTWVAGGDVAGVVHLVAHPSRSGELLAIDGAAHILRTSDYGVSWRALPNAPDFGCGGSLCVGPNPAMSLAIESGVDTLYVATSGQGVFTYSPLDTRRPRTVRAVSVR